MRIYTEVKIDFSFLYQLSYEELFTLAAFMQHEILTEEQHAKIFHQNIKKSALIFNRLRNNGIILIDRINQIRREGASRRTAGFSGAS